ncbi:vezatin-like isoform X2 [Babylonia areolata]|uniref:vezatin-like isoform X2 n=1 Tax=Babylonia areolata TaxID=304850 RepID=UPI003FD69A5F
MAAAADDNDDCEVIFENSPLYWSMVDAGLEGIGEQDVQKISSSDCGFNTNACDNFLWSRICKFCTKELGMLFSLKHTFKLQVKETHRQVFATVAGSSLLTEEDDLFLQDLRAEEQQTETHTPLKTHSRKWLLLSCAAVACLFLWAFSPWWPVSLHPWDLVMANTLLVLLLPMVVAQAAKAWQCRRVGRQGEVLEGSVGRVLRAAGRWKEVSAKCVRFIQESELVARGFTFVGNPGTSRVVRELQSAGTQQRQCPLLRKTLFLASRSAFFTWRRSFAHLVQMCPVKVEVSGVTRYCSEIPLSQYPAMLQQSDDGEADETTETALHDMSDGFSIDVLKSLQELNYIHASEFLRRLAVCFIWTHEGGDVCVSVASLLDTVSHELEKLHTALQSCLTAHRHGSVSTAVRSHRSVAWQPPSSASQLRLTYTAMHSLELHLLAALKKIQDLSEAMEKKLDEDESKAAGDEREVPHVIEEMERESWSQMLATIRSELGACGGCLEEGVKQLESKNTPECRAAVVETAAVQTVHPSVNVTKVSAQDTPIILDEVFEAYSEPQDYASGRGHCELTASEEEVWQKKQKSTLKLCLRELQSIIDVRAAQRQERERIAMDRMKHAPTTTHDLLVPEERKQGLTQEEDLETCRSAEQGDSADDLANDLAERVEFWKQFDQKVNKAAVSHDTQKDGQLAKDPSEEEQVTAMVKESRPKENNDSAVERENLGERCGEFHQKESCHCVKEVSVPASNDTGFVCVSDQAFDRDLTVHDQTLLISENKQCSNHSQNTPLSNPPKTTQDTQNQHSHNLPSDVSPVEQHYSDFYGDDIDNDAINSDTDKGGDDDDTPVGNERKFCIQKPSERITSDRKTEADRAGGQVRSVAEGVREHLSLPAAPSPFAFSIASMVASRARNLAHTEDTFGDTSSDDDDEDDERDEGSATQGEIEDGS